MPGWSGRVTIRPGDGGYAYVPGEILVDVSDPADVAVAADLLGCQVCDDQPCYENPEDPNCCNFGAGARDAFNYVKVPYKGDVPGAVRRLRAVGLTAQPNHVFFADSARRRVLANPVYADPVYADPVYADPVYADPVYADPVYADRYGPEGHGRRRGGCSCGKAQCQDSDPCTCTQSIGANSLVDPNPILADKFYPQAVAQRYQQTGVRPTNAVPTYPLDGTELPEWARWHQANVRVAVIDTGWPLSAAELDAKYEQNVTANAPKGIRGGDVPDSVVADDYMDPAAGHGIFIAGLINQYAPKAAVEVIGRLSTFGDGNEEAIAQAIDDLVAGQFDLAPRDLQEPLPATPEESTRAIAAAEQERQKPNQPPHILSLSFGTYAPEAPERLSQSIAAAIEAGVVVVASAGNDGTSRKSYPGAYEGVVSVGALGNDGRPAPFSNWGEWVRACAPGVDVASGFWGFISRAPNGEPLDRDHYEGWALWSGTSFAAPIVAAHLAQIMEQAPDQDVVEMAIDNPRLVRLPCYGTVVNPPSTLPAL